MKKPPKIEMIHGDCMEYMAGLPDNAFDLAIVDPPYGIGASDDKRGNTKYGNAAAFSKSYGAKEWDKKTPDDCYFNELFRVSNSQIIWGANHFLGKVSPCWIVWDKLTGKNGYADCELAWTSFKTAVRKFTFRWQGMIQQDMKNKETRIHPTQKPVALYKWLLTNYAKPGDRILDTHGGSGSIAIACHDLGFDLVWIEKDKDYYEAAVQRFKNHTAQLQMF